MASVGQMVQKHVLHVHLGTFPSLRHQAEELQKTLELEAMLCRQDLELPTSTGAYFALVKKIIWSGLKHQLTEEIQELTFIEQLF